MTSLRLCAVLALLSACGNDLSKDMYIAPSAAHLAPKVHEAASMLNALTGEATFSVYQASDGERRDGETIIRSYQGDMFDAEHDRLAGRSTRTPQGVIIRLPQHARVRAIAHEMGHSAGLEHVDDPANLMFETAFDAPWTLTEQQLDDLR